MNDNRMTLYRIRRKADGLFLAWAPTRMPGGHLVHWNRGGCFWRTQETIIEHLLELCKYRVYCSERGSVHNKSTRRKPTDKGLHFVVYPHDTPHRVASINYNWLDKYEVVATEVTEHASKTMEARDFASLMNDERIA